VEEERLEELIFETFAGLFAVMDRVECTAAAVDDDGQRQTPVDTESVEL
jgi:hypothetical protein